MPRLSRTQRRKLLTALVISLSFLLCLQMCLFLPVLVRQDNPGDEADRLLAISQSIVAPEVTSPWAAFQRPPRVCARCCRLQSQSD